MKTSGTAKTQPPPFPFPAKRLYFGTEGPRRLTRLYAAAIAEEFHPAKIIRFGSHADGTPKEDSDADLLVVLPTSGTRRLVGFAGGWRRRFRWTLSSARQRR